MVEKSICLKTPFGEIFLASDWSSSCQGHRESIRTELYKKTKDKSFLDLKQVPKSDIFFVSISHCRSLGGYALNLKKDVGFDVEDLKRIKPEIIKRISTEKDRELFTEKDCHFLWVIKEAAFKLMSCKGDVMSEVIIQSLDKVGEHSYLGTLTIKGVRAEFLCGEVGEACIFSLVKK